MFSGFRKLVSILVGPLHLRLGIHYIFLVLDLIISFKVEHARIPSVCLIASTEIVFDLIVRTTTRFQMLMMCAGQTVHNLFHNLVQQAAHILRKSCYCRDVNSVQPTNPSHAGYVMGHFC